MYHSSADKGANWGGATTALAVANVIYIAAVSTTKVHYATLTSKNNTRLGLIEDTGSWAATNSYIWWPFEPTSFDAVTWGQYDDGAAAINDIIAFTCDFPPLTRIRVDGDEIVRNLERVQGIALFRYQNGLWSHHRTFDMIDNVESGLIPARQGLRLTTYDDNEPWIFMTYNRVSGTEAYPHKTLAISRSRTGLHWEMPYLIPAYKVGTCAPLVVNGDYCYLVDSTGRKAKSIVVGYLDSSNTTQYDLSANVLSIDVTSGDAKNVQVTIANPNGELDATIEATKMWRMFIKLGWYVNGVETNITTTTVFLDTVSQSKILPTDHYILSGRDALGRSISTRADEVQEWDHTQITGDNFAQMDDTAYSGMRNTAAFTGYWETAGGILILKESENTGIAFNIKTSYVWNGGARCAVQVAATDTDDLGGVIFRALDHENFWYCVYDADNDRLVLAERKENTDTVYGTKSSMGWAISTWYYIDVEYSYNYISVYAGTSPANLALQFQHEVDGVPDGTSFTFDNIPLMEGSQGYYGHGYSEYSPSYPSFPTPPPLPEDPVETIRSIVGTWAAGVYYNPRMEGPTGDLVAWTAINAGLDGYRYSIRLELDPFDEHNRQYYLVSDEDSTVYHGDLFRRESQGSWTSILTSAEAADVISETNAVIYDISADELNDGYLYAGIYDTDNDDVWVIRSTNYGTDWSVVKKVATSVLYVNKYWNMLSIKVVGSRIFLNVYDDFTSDTSYYISDDSGSSFTKSSSAVQNNFSDNPVFFNALQNTPYFCGEKSGVTTYATLCRFDSPDDWETVIPAVGLGSDHLYYIWDEQVWGSSVNVGVYSGIDYSGTPDVLHYTDDNWATYNTVVLESTILRMHWRDPDDEDLYFFAGGGLVYTSTDRGATITWRGSPSGGVVWGCFKFYRSNE